MDPLRNEVEMIKEIESCKSVYEVNEKKKIKVKNIKKSQKYIEDCDIRIKQLEFQNKNQLKFKI